MANCGGAGHAHLHYNQVYREILAKKFADFIFVFFLSSVQGGDLKICFCFSLFVFSRSYVRRPTHQRRLLTSPTPWLHLPSFRPRTNTDRRQVRERITVDGAISSPSSLFSSFHASLAILGFNRLTSCVTFRHLPIVAKPNDSGLPATDATASRLRRRRSAANSATSPAASRWQTVHLRKTHNNKFFK